MCLDEETIRDFFNKEQKKWELKKLIKKWKIDEADKEYFNDILKTLEEEGKIIIDEGRQMVMAFPKESNFLYGQIHINKSGNGLLEIDNKKYFVPSDCLEASLSGDMVIIEKYNQVNDGKILAVVRKVVKRKRDILVADYDGEELTLYGNKLNYPIKVNKEEEKRLEPGARVLLKIQKNLNDNVIFGEVIKVIGNRDDLDLDLKTILAELEIPLDFSEESLKELETFPDEVLEEELANRIDFTNDPIVTIDCDNTKDMDDAVFVKKLDNGHYELDVHIADVGHYVKKDSALFQDAYLKGTSVYMGNTVNPMIPHKLSNGLCSLNPNKIRLTRSTIIEIDEDGKIVDFRLCKGYIKSRMKMAYSAVNKLLNNKGIMPGYEKFIDDLRLMQELENILEKRAVERGFLDFESNEIKVQNDGLNRAYSFEKQEQGCAEKIIEFFMIYANVCNARYCKWNNIDTIYRVHDIPDESRITKTINYICSLGYRIQNVKNVENPRVIQGVLKELRNKDIYPILSNLLLRGMQKASYSTIDSGHYGLALEDYAHTTSPIRRLPDLIMQIELNNWEDYLLNPDLVDFTKLEEELRLAAQQSSKTERLADKAEEEANKMFMADYMSDHIGDEFEGIITEISPYGIMVQCNNQVVGKVTYGDILGDNFVFDKENFKAIGRSTKKQYHVGDKVLVSVKDASKEYRTVYFQLEERLKKSKVLNRQLIND